jgi:hypothetical protein
MKFTINGANNLKNKINGDTNEKTNSFNSDFLLLIFGCCFLFCYDAYRVYDSLLEGNTVNRCGLVSVHMACVGVLFLSCQRNT